MKRWPTKLLCELCEFRHGNTPSKAELRNWSGSFPWVSPKDMRAEIISNTQDHLSPEAIANNRAAIAKKNSLLVVVRSGILAHTFPVAIAGRDVAFNQDLKALRVVSPATTPRYLFRFLQASSSQILTHGTKRGATVHSLQSGFLESLPAPMPPLAEQERIVKLLDEADELRKLRAQADRRTADLIPSLFHEMFGDPDDNQRGWACCQVSSFVEELHGGRSVNPAGADEAAGRFRVLKISAVTWGEFNPEESKPVPAMYEPPESHFVRAGDLLFSRANTSELVAATSYVFDTPPNLLLPDKLWRFVWKQPQVVEPLFVWWLFQAPSVRRELGQRATGTGGSMKNISKPKVMSVKVPLPPLPLQKEFAARVSEIRALQAEQTASRCRLEHLFQSLLHRAFQGEL